ncbi:MAG: tyrosine-type recombinase/integrase, partial [Verrucomicrobiales bacterium]|nr:tyrosine-type recombinase/integrase [Verrucomicrobiales bacterium]
LGFKLERHETRVRQFVEFFEEQKASRITTKLALQFATQDPDLNSKTKASRLSVVRAFARYRIGTDPTTEIPPLGLLPYGPRRTHPYIYSEAEIRLLLTAAKNYPSRNRFPGWGRFQGWTFYCIFGLLAVTGMRVGEVLNLQAGDIDWTEGVLTVRNAKFGKSRLVPLHRSTQKVLARFVRDRDRLFAQQQPGQPLVHLFVSSCGTRLHVARIRKVFWQLSRQIGLRAPGARQGPRIHDFRHRFAVETLLRWYQCGEPVDRRMPVLSTYLGHTNVSSTYWYLSCTPKLMAAAGDRLEQRWKGIR